MFGGSGPWVHIPATDSVGFDGAMFMWNRA
jgi:hypothetical protein